MLKLATTGLLAALFVSGVAEETVALDNSHLQLPSLGETSAGLISVTEEYERGQMVLRYYRAALPISQDPFIETYLQGLLQTLVTFSDLPNKKLELLVLDNPQLNAFAAPGGIVGVNTGIFLSAENEHQLASILAHELAHLSQRHYARRVQQGKKSFAVTLAGVIASLMLASAGEGDAAMAGILLSQSATRDSSLKFSREMEKEADRIGLRTLIQANFDPQGMPSMFEEMLKQTRYRTHIPDFLLSHPVTESRISDTASRVQKLPRKYYPQNEDYQLIRARVMLRHEENPQNSVKRFKTELESPNKRISEITASYGYTLSLIAIKQFDEARKALAQLKAIVKNPVIHALTEADIAAGELDFDTAIDVLKTALRSNPNNHALNVRYAEILMRAGKYRDCEVVLLAHSQRFPNNAYVWYLLAEVHGLAGHILEVHKARAEYFMLKGVYSKAEIQLRNALKLIDKEDFQSRAKIEQRLLDLENLVREAREFQ